MTLLQATSELNRLIKSLKSLEDASYLMEIKDLRQELDELNFSYYEILNEHTERLDATEKILRDRVVDGSEDLELFTSPQRLEYDPLEGIGLATDRDKNLLLKDMRSQYVNGIESQRSETVKRMINLGMSDQEIAKTLNIGVGEVQIIKRM